MVLDELFADQLALAMASVSVAFMVPAAVYAYLIRKELSKALLILAASKVLYRYLFVVLASALGASVAHLIYHVGEFLTVPLEVELFVHVAIDSMFILVAVSLFLTFRTAYGMLRKGATRNDIESKLRQSATKLTDEFRKGKQTDATDAS
ncbi:MAG: hypothetical protein ABI361_00110 [Nitrososphaera sp.]|jgi:hypothetical protein